MQNLPEDVFACLKIAYFATTSNQSFEEVFKINESIETIIENLQFILNETPFLLEEHLQQKISNDIPQEIMQYLNIAKLAIESNQTFEEFFKLGDSVDTIVENIDRLLYVSDELIEEDYIVLTRTFTYNATKYFMDENKNIYNDNDENIGTLVV
jgi:hypothetical protein